MPDVTVREVTHLPVGGNLVTEGLLLGLSDEPITWTLVSSNPPAGEYICDATYFGAKLGRYALLVKGEAISVELLDDA